MKILLIHQYFLEKGDGGGSRFNEMTQVWANQGHEITVLAGMVHYATGKKPEKYKGKYFFTDLDFYNNVDVIRSHVSESYNTNFLGRLWAYFSFVFSSIYAGLFKTNKKFDVILVTSPPLFVGITAYVLSKIKSVPFVFEIRDLWPESAIDTGVLKNKMIIKFAYWFERFIYKKAALINVLTPAFREKLIVDKKIDPKKVIFIPNAADFSLAESIQENFDATAFKKELNLQDKFVITYVGAHGVANHLIQLIETAERLKDTNVVFQLIGAGMQKDMLVEEAAKRKLNNIIFRDSVAKKEVFKYILASDAGASVLKKVDTFKTIYSNKTFDYMSCKKPILLAIDGVSRDLVEQAKCGYYVEPENPEEIEKGIRLMLANKESLNIMGENGFNHAKKYFDRRDLASKYTNKIKEVLE
ncbi:glycosyltransferase involved in cell wall biosynthesis [Lacinutrix venerupis]|uniref:glycosyltransferase family 4 protein n=1 Tax=Lacinutrix venerupis TaxID=1486034 RepID=UPI000EB3DD7D|nr:glycosyltransferase family 4 protein [Lacinutrix venerupis]RLJ63282.1 glycosyltransferase involved in cell wall biosynthesis [Lacinutrix venerupis]